MTSWGISNLSFRLATLSWDRNISQHLRLWRKYVTKFKMWFQTFKKCDFKLFKKHIQTDPKLCLRPRNQARDNYSSWSQARLSWNVTWYSLESWRRALHQIVRQIQKCCWCWHCSEKASTKARKMTILTESFIPPTHDPIPLYTPHTDTS